MCKNITHCQRKTTILGPRFTRFAFLEREPASQPVEVFRKGKTNFLEPGKYLNFWKKAPAAGRGYVPGPNQMHWEINECGSGAKRVPRAAPPGGG